MVRVGVRGTVKVWQLRACHDHWPPIVPRALGKRSQVARDASQDNRQQCQGGHDHAKDDGGPVACSSRRWRQCSKRGRGVTTTLPGGLAISPRTQPTRTSGLRVERDAGRPAAVALIDEHEALFSACACVTDTKQAKWPV